MYYACVLMYSHMLLKEMTLFSPVSIDYNFIFFLSILNLVFFKDSLIWFLSVCPCFLSSCSKGENAFTLLIPLTLCLPVSTFSFSWGNWFSSSSGAWLYLRMCSGDGLKISVSNILSAWLFENRICSFSVIMMPSWCIVNKFWNIESICIWFCFLLNLSRSFCIILRAKM